MEIPIKIKRRKSHMDGVLLGIVDLNKSQVRKLSKEEYIHTICQNMTFHYSLRFDIGHVYFKHRDVFEYLYKTDISEIWEKGNEIDVSITIIDS
jgi:hypothetical protein